MVNCGLMTEESSWCGGCLVVIVGFCAVVVVLCALVVGFCAVVVVVF